MRLMEDTIQEERQGRRERQLSARYRAERDKNDQERYVLKRALFEKEKKKLTLEDQCEQMKKELDLRNNNFVSKFTQVTDRGREKSDSKSTQVTPRYRSNIY